MQQKYIKKQYEIFSITSELVLVKSIKKISIEKLNYICQYVVRETKNDTFWFYNIDDNEFQIYTQKCNLKQAKEAIKEFEADYNSVLKKRRMIIAYRHNLK